MLLAVASRSLTEAKGTLLPFASNQAERASDRNEGAFVLLKASKVI
jgi:hypothetical protein